MSTKKKICSCQSVTEFEPTEGDKEDLKDTGLGRISSNLKRMVEMNEDVELVPEFNIKEVNHQGVFIVKLFYYLEGPKQDLELAERKFLRGE